MSAERVHPAGDRFSRSRSPTGTTTAPPTPAAETTFAKLIDRAWASAWLPTGHPR